MSKEEEFLKEFKDMSPAEVEKYEEINKLLTGLGFEIIVNTQKFAKKYGLDFKDPRTNTLARMMLSDLSASLPRPDDFNGFGENEKIPEEIQEALDRKEKKDLKN